MSHSPVIAIIDDYERFVPSLAAYNHLRKALPGAVIRVIDQQPFDKPCWSLLADVEYLVLVRERTKVTDELLGSMPSLKAIVQTGGCGDPATSHIDLAACSARGVKVLEGRHSDGFSAAELAWGLVLSATRQIPAYMVSMHEGKWQQGGSPRTISRSLRGQTLGILGYGRIGQLMGRFGMAFEMSLLVWGGENSKRAASEHGVRFATSRDELFAQSDVVTLHLRMNANTRHSIGVRDLTLMKTTSLLVNTARPGLIAPGALEEALKQGHPGRAALDVHEHEPILVPKQVPCAPASISTPHIGYVERESYEILFGAAFKVLLEELERTF